MKLSTFTISILALFLSIQSIYGSEISITIDDKFSNKLQTELKNKHIFFKYQPYGCFTISKNYATNFISIALSISNKIFSGNPNAPFPYEDMELYRFGYMNSNGEVVIKPKYAIAGNFNRYNIAAVAGENGWEYIDINGDTYLKPFVFDNGPDYFKEGLSRYVENNLIGFIDETYHVVIKAQYEFVAPFNSGYATFCVGCREVPVIEGSEHTKMEGGKWGVINKKGEVVVQAIYDTPVYFENNKALVKRNGQFFYIDEKGNKLHNK